MTQSEDELYATIASLRTTEETRRFLRDLEHSLLDAPLLFVPLLPAQTIQRRYSAFRADIPRQPIGLVYGHIELSPILIFHR